MGEGGNEKATRLSGINTKKVYFFAYVNMGLLAALAGILTIARLTSSQPTYGQGYEMDAIGACFIGGASAYGGVGTVPGVVIGAVLMGVINQGMSILLGDDKGTDVCSIQFPGTDCAERLRVCTGSRYADVYADRR